MIAVLTNHLNTSRWSVITWLCGRWLVQRPITDRLPHLKSLAALR